MDLPVYRLKLLDDFRCLAGDCPDDCCGSDWHIDVDGETVARWQTLEDATLRERLLGALERVEADGREVWRLVMAGRRCTLQDPDGLCMVHARLGPGFLGRVCREYPRQSRDFTTRRVETLALSCPEVARLVFSATAPAEPFARPETGRDPDDPAAILENFVGRVLRARAPAAARVVVMARMLVEMSRRAAEDRLTLDGLKGLCGNVRKPVEAATRELRSGRLRPDSETAGRFWTLVYRLTSVGKKERIDARVTGSPLARMFEREEKSESDYAALGTEVKRLREAATNAVRALHPDPAGRYLAVKFTSSGFPFAPFADNYIAAFLFAVLPLSFIQLYLWILYDAKGSLEPADLVNAVYQTERIDAHSWRIYRYIVDNPAILHLDRYEGCFGELL